MIVIIYLSSQLTLVQTQYRWIRQQLINGPILLGRDITTVSSPRPYHQSAHNISGEWIWGRGSADDKLSLISVLYVILSSLDHSNRMGRLSIETLLTLNFSPQRTTVLAFGFDEEISGTHGAAKIAVHLEEIYGRNGFSILIDEGSGMADMFGATFASPAIGEKGYLDVKIEVTTPGGHSSIPPANHHTVSSPCL